MLQAAFTLVATVVADILPDAANAVERLDRVSDIIALISYQR